MKWQINLRYLYQAACKTQFDKGAVELLYMYPSEGGKLQPWSRVAYQLLLDSGWNESKLQNLWIISRTSLQTSSSYIKNPYKSIEISTCKYKPSHHCDSVTSEVWICILVGLTYSKNLYWVWAVIFLYIDMQDTYCEYIWYDTYFSHTHILRIPL